MHVRSRLPRVATAIVIACVSSNCGGCHQPRLFSVAHGDGRYVAVGEAGVIVSSTDLDSWNAETSDTTTNLADVGFGDGLFVAVGDRGETLSSRDGHVWRSASTGSTNDLNAVTFSGALSLWIAVGEEGEVWSSAGGAEWTARHSGTAWLSEVAASDTGLLAVEAGGAGELTSEDGLVWTRTDQPDLGGRCGVAYGDDTWVSADFAGGIQKRPGADSSTVWQTPKAGLWSAVSECDVVAGDDFFAVADNLDGSIFTSRDGESWEKQFKSANALRGLTVVGDELVAVGSFGEVAHASCPAGKCGSFSEQQVWAPGNAPDEGEPVDLAPGGSSCAHWDCGGSSQCETVMGGSAGNQCEFEPGQSCEDWCDTYIPGNCTCSADNCSCS